MLCLEIKLCMLMVQVHHGPLHVLTTFPALLVDLKSFYLATHGQSLQQQLVNIFIILIGADLRAWQLPSLFLPYYQTNEIIEALQKDFDEEAKTKKLMLDVGAKLKNEIDTSRIVMEKLKKEIERLEMT